MVFNNSIETIENKSTHHFQLIDGHYKEAFTNEIKGIVIDEEYVEVSNQITYEIYENKNEVSIEVITEGVILDELKTYEVPGNYKLTIEDSIGNLNQITIELVKKSVTNKDHYELLEDEQLEFNPLLNDINGVIFDSLNEPLNGRIEKHNNVYTYIPNHNFYGTERLLYNVLFDNELHEEEIIIYVNPVNDFPVVKDDYFEISASNQLDFLNNDYDIDSSFYLHAISLGSKGGKIEKRENDYFYVPKNGFVDEETFIYQVKDNENQKISSILDSTVGFITVSKQKIDSQVSQKEVIYEHIEVVREESCEDKTMMFSNDKDGHVFKLDSPKAIDEKTDKPLISNQNIGVNKPVFISYCTYLIGLLLFLLFTLIFKTLRNWLYLFFTSVLFGMVHLFELGFIPFISFYTFFTLFFLIFERKLRKVSNKTVIIDTSR